MDIQLPGIFVPPLTPFTEAGEVDFAALERVIDYTIERCSPAAVVVCGVEAQEYQFLTPAQRVELTRRSVELVAGRAPVVIGISHPNWKQACELAELAASLGAAALQVLIPRKTAGGDAPLSEIIEYFQRIGECVRLPLVAYHNPGPGAEPGVKGMIEIARLPFVKYVKESSRDLSRVGLLIAEIEHAGLAHYLTTLQMLLASLELGGSGGTMPPPGARISAAILAAFRAGDMREAARLQGIFRVFPAKWMSYGLTAAMKAAARSEGEDWGLPHAPGQALSASDQVELDGYLAQAGALDVRV